MSVAATEFPVPPDISPEQTLTAAEWGTASFLLSEVAFFGTLLATYVAFMGRDLSGPTPAEILSLPLVLLSTFFLLSSSATIHFAEAALHRNAIGRFCLLWGLTILLGLVFLGMTAFEWYELIYEKHFTIGTNLFGTTYYTLIGFHAIHVTAGIIVMLIMLGLGMNRQLSAENPMGIRMVSWYWHFVDVVWVVVFLVVYVASRSSGL